jgi:hypothetical protein
MVSIDLALGLCRGFRNTNLFQARGVPLSWTTSPHPTATNLATPPATSGQCPPQHQTSCEGRKALQLNVDFRRYRANLAETKCKTWVAEDAVIAKPMLCA